MPIMREAWTDERLDDLSAKVDRGFERMDARFDRMEDRFDSLQRTMIQGGAVMIAALIGLVATQL